MTQGTISYIGPVKDLGKSGKLKSVGIKLVEDPEEKWRNIKAFSVEGINEIKGDTQVGDFAELDETPNEWESENEAEPSIKKITILKRGGKEEVSPEQKKEDLKAFMPEESQKSARELVEECIEEANEIVKKFATKEIFLNVNEVADMLRRTRLVPKMRR